MTQAEDGQWKVAGEGELPGPNAYYTRQQYAKAWETIHELGSDLCTARTYLEKVHQEVRDLKR